MLSQFRQSKRVSYEDHVEQTGQKETLLLFQLYEARANLRERDIPRELSYSERREAHKSGYAQSMGRWALGGP